MRQRKGSQSVLTPEGKQDIFARAQRGEPNHIIAQEYGLHPQTIDYHLRQMEREREPLPTMVDRLDFKLKGYLGRVSRHFFLDAPELVSGLPAFRKEALARAKRDGLDSLRTCIALEIAEPTRLEHLRVKNIQSPELAKLDDLIDRVERQMASPQQG